MSLSRNMDFLFARASMKAGNGRHSGQQVQNK